MTVLILLIVAYVAFFCVPALIVYVMYGRGLIRTGIQIANWFAIIIFLEAFPFWSFIQLSGSMMQNIEISIFLVSFFLIGAPYFILSLTILLLANVLSYINKVIRALKYKIAFPNPLIFAFGFEKSIQK